MSEDKLAFLDQQPRDERGRFASSAEPPAPAAEPAAAPPEQPQPPPSAPAPEPPTTDTSPPAPAAQPATPPPGYIPLAAALDDRDKRQAAERERDELRRWIEANAPKPQQQLLDPLDQEGFDRELNNRFGDFEWR